AVRADQLECHTDRGRLHGPGAWPYMTSPGRLACSGTSSVLPSSGGTSSRSARRAGSDVARGRSSRARQTAVVVLDVMLNRGPAITPDEEVAFPLGQRDAYEGWLITPPYITRITMVRTKSWL